MPVDIEVLRRIPYFAPLRPEELTRIAAVTIKRHYKRGDLIILEGDLSEALYYVTLPRFHRVREEKSDTLEETL